MVHTFSVAGIPFSLIADQGLRVPDPPHTIQPFISNEPGSFRIRVTREEPPLTLEHEHACFQTEQWFFYQIQDRLVAKVRPHKVSDSWVHVQMEPFLSRATIYLDERFYQEGRYPLSTPMFEIIFTTLLARQGGLLMHSSGVLRDQQALMFTGSSGTGKTTSARLWERYASASVLCDDRIAVLAVNGEFFAFGTPWHGVHQSVLPHGGRLEKIFFLKHAQENCAERMSLRQASAMLYARSFPPLWDRVGLDAWVDNSVKLAQQVPCFEFGFVPDASSVEYLRGLE